MLAADRTAGMDQLFGVLGAFIPHGMDYSLLVTRSNSLVAGILLQGNDCDGNTPAEFSGLTVLADSVYGSLQPSLTVTQCYSHFHGAPIALKPRDDRLSHLLSQRRQAYINENARAGSCIVHYIEIKPADDINVLSFIKAIKHAGLAPFQKASREILKNYFSADKAVLLHLSQLNQMAQVLDDHVQQIIAKWSAVMKCRLMTRQELWAHQRFMANLDPSLLVSALDDVVPEDDWDLYS